jgi:hypothetical protein
MLWMLPLIRLSMQEQSVKIKLFLGRNAIEQPIEVSYSSKTTVEQLKQLILLQQKHFLALCCFEWVK